MWRKSHDSEVKDWSPGGVPTHVSVPSKLHKLSSELAVHKQYYWSIDGNFRFSNGFINILSEAADISVAILFWTNNGNQFTADNTNPE